MGDWLVDKEAILAGVTDDDGFDEDNSELFRSSK